MAPDRPHPRHGRRRWAGWASFLVILLLGPAAWPEAATRPRVQVAVHHGRLSVDLWEAELGEVLTQIGQQAGILIRGSPRAGTRISAQIIDVELDPGLRHVLQRAAQSYAICYVPGPTGGVVIQEVRIFETAPAKDPATILAESAGEDPGVEAVQRFLDALGQSQAAAPALVDEEENAVAHHFRAALAHSLTLTPGAPNASAQEAVRRFQDILERSIGTPRR